MGENKAGPPPGMRVAGGRLAYERGIRYSSLPAPSRHIALTIATWADVETGMIPDRFQPAKETLEAATGLSRGAIVKHLNLLEAEGWLSRETSGGRSRRTKFRLRIPEGAKTGHVTTPFEAGNGSPGDLFPEETGHLVPETGHVVNENGSPGDPKSSSSTNQSPPPTDPSASPRPGGGGGDQQQEAEAFLQSLPSPWTAGRKTARDLAPLLLERTAEQGWQLDADLATQLSKNPDGVNNHRAVLRSRIDDLPKKPTTRTRASPTAQHPMCRNCGLHAPAACTANGRDYCADCTTECTGCQVATPTDDLDQGHCPDCQRSSAA